MIADVEKMYRQVYVEDKHTDFQRIVWRRSTADPIQDYRLLRVTYGVASASYCAVKYMQQTAIAIPEKVARITQLDFWVVALNYASGLQIRQSSFNIFRKPLINPPI